MTMKSTVENLERIERKIVRKKIEVKDPEALRKLIFGDNQIKVEDCIKVKTVVKQTKACKHSSKHREKAGFKKCTCCGEVKDISQYYKHDITNDGYRYYCIPCYKKDMAVRYQNKKEELV